MASGESGHLKSASHAARIETPHSNRADLYNLRRMLPYLWTYRGRVLIALSCLIVAKVATVGVPLVLKRIVDALDTPGQQALALPLALLLAYGGLRMTTSLFNELRDSLFARVRFGAMHGLSHQVLEHLHVLSLSYHLERRTGQITRDLERGARSVANIVNNMVFSILPTIAEFALVAVILLSQYAAQFTLVTFAAVFVYIIFTFSVTNWRMHHRHEMNALDSQANSQAIDSLLNYETVKYFNNEQHEIERYHETLKQWEDAAVNSATTMSMLNFGQGAIVACGVTAIMILAAQGVSSGEMSLGDLVLVNAMMLQLFMPLNTLGIMYRQLRYSLADMDLVYQLLDTPPQIQDSPAAQELRVVRPHVRFTDVEFCYEANRPTLKDISFEIQPGQKVAVVGPSGAGKSTLARLLFRFYDINNGAILIDGQDISACTQDSLRRCIGIVPQDTVLFNDTILYNILYARPEASRAEVEHAARLADIHDFICSLPAGYDSVVGERGLKLSGGEKQRMAIARVILKQASIVVFDEATSSLDSRSEGAILQALGKLAKSTTTLVIAHRLSTIVDADSILVMEHGRIVERGRHAELLIKKGLYSHLWALQQEERTIEKITESRQY